MHNCYIGNYIVEMGNFNSFIDKLDMDFWHEICANNGKLCYYKKRRILCATGGCYTIYGNRKRGIF